MIKASNAQTRFDRPTVEPTSTGIAEEKNWTEVTNRRPTFYRCRQVRSVALNIAQGASSRFGAKRRYYQIARKSCGEVLAANELAFDLGESLPVAQVQMTG